LKNLFTQIEEMTPRLHGWCSVPKAQILASAVIALRPKICVEIGVWGGRSLFPMALAMKELGRGAVIGIDPWQAEASVVGQVNEADRKYWGHQPNHDLVYADFMGRIEPLGLTNILRVLRKKSDEVEPPEEIGILHIDGNHSDQAVKDVERFATKCPVGALCFMDDIGWSGGGVQRAVARLEAMGWRFLYNVDTSAVYQRQ
jgi:hypothetical protein